MGWIVRISLHDQWSHLSMLHWRIQEPPWEDADLHDGSAWLSVVAFCSRGIRKLLPLSFGGPQINVRTYLRAPAGGVRFLDVLSGDGLACVGARMLGLPYRRSTVAVDDRHVQAPGLRFAVAPDPEPLTNVDRWLLDRYTVAGTPAVVRHPPFEATRATCKVWDQDLVRRWVGNTPPALAHVVQPVQATLILKLAQRPPLARGAPSLISAKA